jgi:membrane-associated phospholipid phosphatase
MNPRMPAFLALFCALAMTLTPARAAAEDPAGVDWNQDWPRFRPVEVALTVVMGAQIASVLFLYPDPKQNWDSGLFFDDNVRAAMRLRSKRSRDNAAAISDYIYYALAAYPMLVDTALVTDLAHRKQDVALQMFAINLESYAFSGAFALSLERIGRVRPLAAECSKDPNYSEKCSSEPDRNASFLSGHTAIAFTSAGLMCAHHQHLPLYGGGAPDLLACLTAMAAASTSGVLRISSDNHYASDVILATMVGLFGGYGLPSLLHYGFTSGKKSPSASILPRFRSNALGAPISAVLAPRVDTTGAGLSLTGSF